MLNKLFLSFLLVGSSLTLLAQPQGCTDPLALNYDAAAMKNDGSCVYASTIIKEDKSVVLDDTLRETSGLTLWQGSLLTHNDSDDNNLYVLDSLTGKVLTIFPINGMDPTDWESIAQDDFFFYFGDFGNNAGGNRQDLKIYRISRNAISAANPVINTINFTYEGQTDFSGEGSNMTDFDCEAMFVKNDSLYLLTKEWVSEQTTLYVLPKAPGTYEAKRRGSLDVQGLITGVSYQADKNYLVLSGYSDLLQPFLYLLYDFEGNAFFSGNKRKLDLLLSFSQAEGIAKGSGLNFFLSEEEVSQPPFIDKPPQLYTFNLDPYLGLFVNGEVTTSISSEVVKAVSIYPNPFTSIVAVEVTNLTKQEQISILDVRGNEVHRTILYPPTTELQLGYLPSGTYLLRVGGLVKKIVKE
ncbi:MAG: T9SS type A sorting domain-containing protein [Bacteroidota bacterium]